MFKMQYSIYLAFGVLILSCGSFKSLSDEISVDVNLPANEEISNSFLSNEPVISSFESNNVKKLNLQQQNKLDSIYSILISEKEVLIDFEDRELYDNLIYENLNDTTFLTNIYMKTPTDGSPVSYQYNVLKGDEIYYSFENIGKSKIEEVSILEGDTYRFVKQKFPKKSKQSGKIRIINDNPLTLNVINNGFFKNKGLFGSNLKISLKKVSPLNINYEEVYDSLPSEQIVIKVLNDTIYNSIYNESLVLKPILDITGKSELIVPLDIDPEGKELVGWGYWVSLNPFNTIDWFSNKDNDLINFAKQEFFNSDEKISLQNSVNDNIKLKVNNISLDVRTPNYSGNYALYQTDKKIDKPHRRAEVVIRNFSNIYSYNIKLGLVSVFFKEREVYQKSEVYEKKKFIKLSINE